MDGIEIISDGVNIQDQDIKSIIALIGETDATWNNHDAQAFAALFEEQADFHFHTGIQIQGRDAIEEFWGVKVFPGMSTELRHVGSLERIRFIRNNVAICDGGLQIIKLSSESGQHQVLLDTYGTVIVAKQSAGWYITAIRLTTFVSE